MEESHRITSINHDIFFGNAGQILSNYLDQHPEKKPVLIADENTLKYCWPVLLNASKRLNHAKIIQIKSGEENKNIAGCKMVWETLVNLKISRNDIIINLGGGVVTDLGGFVASTFKRGVPFIQIPTSLLAMVDASIGGKVGVDFVGLKNVIGNFSMPELVIVDVHFLKSLPDLQMKCGFAEVLKHGAILDNAYWQEATKSSCLNLEHIKSLVFRSVELKNSLVLSDFEDTHDRKKLNFGHTIGHAIETHYLNSSTVLLHGEAVAIGMIGEAWLGKESGITSEACLNNLIRTVLKTYKIPNIGFETHDALLEIMRNDKKNIGSTINFTFLKEIGVSVINQTASEPQIRKALSFLNEIAMD
ncbi:MAG: 3-dehydroquinate synthase [Crocinitomicaceae bacterium]|jgi:3-dehydroquinate synthase|nr:3-dehydroquinate synthase [Crocinitomicaceae bacterium]MBT5402794.1 3-dehydroquinate synthase [Crocinitomicaceae bacterium]MBT6029297.1 3-dehydroquinate synthase [Crocinitomicaceae bacterium]MBT6513367.1 3-dehydroquinate synthase [Crocinitomicaceae bacterium]